MYTTKKSILSGMVRMYKNLTPYNSSYPKGGVSCAKDSFVVNSTSVFQIKFCGKSPALRVATNRYGKWQGDRAKSK